jgi:hypothetical protein
VGITFTHSIPMADKPRPSASLLVTLQLGQARRLQGPLLPCCNGCASPQFKTRRDEIRALTHSPPEIRWPGPNFEAYVLPDVLALTMPLVGKRGAKTGDRRWTV